MEWNEHRLESCHQGVPSGASKTISEPVVRSAQTVHLSYVKFSTISKWTESSFQLSLLTMEYRPVRPKWFLSLWHVWRKPCTHLAMTVTLSPNGMKRDSTSPMSPRSSIGCIQNVFWAYGTFGANRHLSCVKISTISKWTESSFHLSLTPRSTIGGVQNDFWAYGTFGANRAPILHRH
jgi:hypothetical protein